MPSKKKYTPLKIPVVTVNGVPQKPTALPKIDGPTQSLAVNTGFSDRIFENFSNLYKKDNDGKTPASGTILDASIVYRNNENQVDKKFVASCICMMFSKRMHAKFAEHLTNLKKIDHLFQLLVIFFSKLSIDGKMLKDRCSCSFLSN